jgi:hypothetical protein
MPWARLDDAFARHLKVQDALDHGLDGLAAIGLWTMALTWSYDPAGGDGTPLVPDRVVPRLAGAFAAPGAKELAAILVAVGLWEDVDGGFLIHDWEAYRAPELTGEQRRAGGLARAAQAVRGPGGTFLPGGGTHGGKHQQEPGGTSSHLDRWTSTPGPGDLDQQPGTNPNPREITRKEGINRQKRAREPRPVQRTTSGEPVMTDQRWEPFMEAWGKRFRYRPTVAQAEALWDGIRDWPQAMATFVLDCPQGTPAREVVGMVLDRVHAIRDQAAADAARSEVEADARRRELAVPRNGTGQGPKPLAAILDGMAI